MRLRPQQKDNWWSVEWVYGLVFRHYSNTHEKGQATLMFYPFGYTTSSGGSATFESWVENRKLRLPRRDGVHIKVESKLLGLPAYATCQEKGMCQKIEYDEAFEEGFKLMSRS